MMKFFVWSAFNGFCIVLYLYIYIALLAVLSNQKRFQCKRPREKRHYSLFNYLLNELLFIKIDLVFVEFLNFKFRTLKTQTLGKSRFSEFISIPTRLP